MPRDERQSARPVARALSHYAGDATVPAFDAHEITLFEPSRGLSERASQPAGLGLGLHISRQIARAHRGDIAVHSDESGTTFSVELPRRRQRGMLPRSVLPPRFTSSRRAKISLDARRFAQNIRSTGANHDAIARDIAGADVTRENHISGVSESPSDVVIVEDDADHRAMRVDLLAADGHVVRAYASAEVAHAAVLEHTPDIVIADLQFEGVAGWTLAEMSRSDARTRHVALVAVTGAVDHDARWLPTSTRICRSRLTSTCSSSSSATSPR